MKPDDFTRRHLLEWCEHQEYDSDAAEALVQRITNWCDDFDAWDEATEKGWSWARRQSESE